MLSDRILALRKSKNISQEKMAELFSVSRQAIQKWEQGAAVPELDKLLAMAKHFDVSLDYLVGGVDRRDTEELRLDRNILPSYYALHDWECYAAGLETEFTQSMEEGLDAGRLEGLFKETAKLPSGPDKEAIGDILFHMLLNAKVQENYPYEEPSDYQSIHALARHTPAEPAPADSILEGKLFGAWLGRACGCLLGKTVEGMRLHELVPFLKETGNYPMHRYILRGEVTEEVSGRYAYPLAGRCFADTVPCGPADDDTNYTVLALKLVEEYGRGFTPKDMADFWLRMQPKNAYCTAERVAFRNFVNGYLPPDSARYKNPYREWIGAQIRGDYFGYINPGDPEAAAEMAFRDASISHVKNGIYGEMFAAAMIARAAVSQDIRDIIEAGLREIPENSRLAEGLRHVLQQHGEGRSFEEVMTDLCRRYDDRNGHHWCHTISNAMIVAAALLYGEKDYGKSICLAVQSGFDTDCNGATVGSVLGMVLGAEGIPDQWAAPIHGRLDTSLFGVGQVSLGDLAKTTLSHIHQK